MKERVILLVEDNADDEALTMRALQKNNIANKIVVARDGVEALDYLFARAMHAGRDTDAQPAVILLDLKLPKLDGFDCIARCAQTTGPSCCRSLSSPHPRNSRTSPTATTSGRQ